VASAMPTPPLRPSASVTRRNAGAGGAGVLPVVNFCPQCGVRVGAGHNYCAECGTNLSAGIIRNASRAE
jgi:hypothetical protein